MTLTDEQVVALLECIALSDSTHDTDLGGAATSLFQEARHRGIEISETVRKNLLEQDGFWVVHADDDTAPTPV